MNIFSMKQKVFFRSSDGLRLAGILHFPKKTRNTGVIICHGYTGSKDTNFIPELGETLEENGFLTLRFDFSGNGESEGRFEERTWSHYVKDLKSAIQFLEGNEDIEDICVIGFSMGAAISIIEYNRYYNFDYLILLAPLLSPTDHGFTLKQFERLENDGYIEFTDSHGRKRRLSRTYFEDMEEHDIMKYAFTLKQFERLENDGYIEFTDSHGRKRRLSRAYFEDMEEHDIMKYAQALDIPVLIIIGDQDNVVGTKNCLILDKRLKSPHKLAILSGENHVFHNKGEKLSPIILEFLETFSP